ncbi:MAG: nitroreductase [Thermodesulfobacteriota bacterium]|nr:nitroreductase [Thermodesulfobacteriota bacterium]
MDIRTAVRERRSIRKFKSDEVSQEVISEILDEARWAPSWGNTQPWELYVVSGAILEKFKMANREKCLKGEAESTEIPIPQVWPETLKKRYTELGKGVLTSQSIGRGDIEARNQYYGDMYFLFGAPCMILVCLDRSLIIEYAMLDAGIMIQTICLLAQEKGLGSCILSAITRYPALLRELLPIPENQITVMGIALGYPDLDSKINNFRRERADLGELVSWVR